MALPTLPIDDPVIRTALAADARAQIAFFRNALNADDGFDLLGHDGQPDPGHPQELHVTTRMVHSYALAHAWGASDCQDIIDAGVTALWKRHRDPEFGGYASSIGSGGHIDDTKLAYGHAFVLLAASSASVIGHDLANHLFDDIERVIDTHFWDEDRGLLKEEFTSNWGSFSAYRGMNANMHGAEAMLAAYEATGREVFLVRAERILRFFTKSIAPQFGWRIPEHYFETWDFAHDYEGNPMFRPRGTTPGHGLEFARLILQHRELACHNDAESLERARQLVETALNDAWLEAGGLAYTVATDGSILRGSRYWWPITEGMGALAALMKCDPRPQDADWFLKLWTFSEAKFIDHEFGGWFPEIGTDGRPASKMFKGKPDIYHSLQATIFPLTPTNSRIISTLAKGSEKRG